MRDPESQTLLHEGIEGGSSASESRGGTVCARIQLRTDAIQAIAASWSQDSITRVDFACLESVGNIGGIDDGQRPQQQRCPRM